MALQQIDQLPPLHRLILEIVEANPGQFSRSELAKLLVGSSSARIAEFNNHPAFGRLDDHGRKAVTAEIDILLQQRYLSLNRANRLVTGNVSL